jgi:hypothetical protein
MPAVPIGASSSLHQWVQRASPSSPTRACPSFQRHNDSSRSTCRNSQFLRSVQGSTVHTQDVGFRDHRMEGNGSPMVHCTNGYSGHLLPRLRGLVHPFKGTMTVQDPHSALARQVSNCAQWTQPVYASRLSGDLDIFPRVLRIPSRGPLRARTVVHCTNGYSGHLLPRLRGLVHPFKGG